MIIIIIFIIIFFLLYFYDIIGYGGGGGYSDNRGGGGLYLQMCSYVQIYLYVLNTYYIQHLFCFLDFIIVSAATTIPIILLIYE